MLTGKRNIALWPVLLRIVVGVSWLAAGVDKIADPTYASASLGPTLARWSMLGHGPIPSFVANALLPNVGVVAFILKVVELLIGIGLILGLLGRLAAFAGFALVLGAWVLKQNFAHISGYANGSFVVMATLLFLVLASSAHQQGVDALRSSRRKVVTEPPAPQM